MTAPDAAGPSVEERLRKALRESRGVTGVVLFPADAEFILAALTARDEELARVREERDRLKARNDEIDDGDAEFDRMATRAQNAEASLAIYKDCRRMGEQLTLRVAGRLPFPRRRPAARPPP